MTLISDWLGFVVEILTAMITAFLAPEKCCPGLACFPMGNPWTSIIRPLPEPKCPDECPVIFQMSFRPNITQIYNVSWPVTSMEHLPFDGNKTTVMYVAGYGFKWWDPWNLEIREVYLKRKDVNFIFLDWGYCNEKLGGKIALATLRVYAAQAARFLKYLVTHHGAHPSRFHIIGHSWGAHLAAYIARMIKGTKRLTGLDPAFYFFWGISKIIQINAADAEFVEVGHSETIPILGAGVEEAKGHVDYYFNGNWLQPSCVFDAGKKSLEDLQKTGTFSPNTFIGHVYLCGHLRALDFYIDALREPNCTLWGERWNTTVNNFNAVTGGTFAANTTSLQLCDIHSCSPWGLEAIDYPARGSFTVATPHRPPYCIPRPDVDERMAELLKEYKEDFYKDYNENNFLR